MADRTPPPLEAEMVEQAPPATTEGADPPPAPEARRWNPPRPKPVALMVLALILIAGVVAILAAWRVGPFAGTTQSTENAYVRGQVTIVSPQVSGYVTEVPVQDFANVKAGDVVARIDDRIYRQRVEQARANVANARASLANNPQQAASRSRRSARSRRVSRRRGRNWSARRPTMPGSRLWPGRASSPTASATPAGRRCGRRRPICGRRRRG
jgi:hypothetical protein